MREQLISLAASILAGMIIMILHEFPKAVVYHFIYVKKQKNNRNTKAEEVKPEEVKAEETKIEEVKTEEVKAEEVKAEEVKTEEVKSEDAKTEEVKRQEMQSLFKIYKYIDPIGVLFCGIFKVGFSKPFYYRIREKRVSFILGLTGLISLLLQIFISSAILRFGFGMRSSVSVPINADLSYLFFMYFLTFYSIISIGMFITNLFPLVAFDMGLLIASSSPTKFYSIIYGDYLIKMAWLFTVLFGILETISSLFFGFLLR